MTTDKFPTLSYKRTTVPLKTKMASDGLSKVNCETRSWYCEIHRIENYRLHQNYYCWR